MNNPNPFVPKGSLLEQQNKRRIQMKVGVLCVLGVSVAGLMVMLIQGCKKQTPEENGLGDTATNSVQTADTNNTPPTDTNQSPATPTNGTVMTAPPTTPVPGTPGMPAGAPGSQPPQSPIVTQPPITPQVPVQPLTPMAPEAGSQYTVVKGDSLAKIAKKEGVTLKALEEANPDVKPTRLKIGQKLNIPAGGKSSADMGAATGGGSTTEGETYTVKSGDTLTKIAKAHHVKVKALQAANGLTTTKIKVGQKLKIPAKAEAAPAPVDSTAPVTAPTVPDNSMPAPAVPQVNPSAVPAQPAPPSTAPAPGH